MSVKSHLTYGASVHLENAVTYSVDKKGQNIRGDLPETRVMLQSMSKNANLLIISTYPRSALSASHGAKRQRVSTSVNNI